MLAVIRDEFGNIDAAISYFLVDKEGNVSDLGKYVYIERLEACPWIEGKEIIAQFIKVLAKRHPNALAAYWERFDKTGWNRHGYKRARILLRSNYILSSAPKLTRSL